MKTHFLLFGCLNRCFLFVEQPLDVNNYEFPDLIENHLFMMPCNAMRCSPANRVFGTRGAVL